MLSIGREAEQFSCVTSLDPIAILCAPRSIDIAAVRDARRRQEKELPAMTGSSDSTDANRRGITRGFLDGILKVSFFKTVLSGEVAQFGSGKCELLVKIKPEHRQFLGAVHGGIIGALADDSCAWACASVAGELVTASYTINLLAAATGDEVVARGSLIKAGRRIIVGKSEVYSVAAGEEKLVAVFQATMSPT
jgi:uncharacterized protein (TIGR00369 family)